MMTIDYPELDVLKDMPGYKAITRALLKIQIQQLVEQLASQTGDESVILTASVCDGTLCHLGTNAGKHFLEVRDEIKSQFLQHCIQRKLGRTQDTSTTQISQYEQTGDNGASNRHHRQQWNANPNTHKQSSMSQGSFRKRPFHRQRMAPSWQRGHSGFGSTLMQQQGLGGARMSNPLHEFRAKQPRLHQARPPPKSTHSSWSQQELDETQNSALSSGAGPEVVQRSPLESETIDLSSDDDAHNLKMATASETDNSPRNMDDVDYEREKEQEEKETDDQHQLETGLSFTDSSLPEDYSKVETADVESRPTEAEIHTNSETSIPVPVSLISAVSSPTSATTVLPPFASVRASSSKMDSNNSAVAGGHDLSVSGAPPLGMDQIDLSLIKAEPVSQDENQTGLLADGNVSGFPDAGWFQNVSAAELALHAAGGDNSASGSVDHEEGTENATFGVCTLLPRKQVRQRSQVSLSTKMELIEYAESEPSVSQRELAKRFGLGKTTIVNILQRKEYYKAEWRRDPDPNNHRFHMDSENSLNKILYESFRSEIANNKELTGTMIRDEAFRIAQRLKMSSFKASSHWLRHWKKRYMKKNDPSLC